MFFRNGASFTDKTATTLKAQTIVAYSVHVVLSNYMQTIQRFLIDQRHTIVRLLSLCTRTDEQDKREDKLEIPFEVERSFIALIDILSMNI